MSKVDTREWKEFKIGDIFYLNIAKSKDFGKLFEGSTPFVGRTSFNNGIQGYVKGLPCEDKDCISISMVGENKAFWQTKSFLASQNILILRKEELSKYNAFFICGILNNFILKNYNYKTTIKLSTFSNEIIKLPIDREGNPDRAYMEVYMKNIEEKCKQSLEELQGVRNTMNHKLDTVDWKRFHLYDEGFFDIDSGTKLDKAKMRTDSPTINFVGRANANNGVTTVINEIEDLKPYPAGYMTLSLGGEYLGSCFIQKKSFYTSQNVVVLKPKRDMSFYVKQFLSTMIFKEGRTFYKAFVDELNRHIKTDFSILVPIDHEGNPNRAYMESYMKNLMEKNQKKLQSLH